jgi:hypothetical protein
MYLLPPHKRKHWLQNACSTIIYYVPCVWIELHMLHLDLNSSIQLNKIKWPWLPSFTFVEVVALLYHILQQCKFCMNCCTLFCYSLHNGASKHGSRVQKY